MKRRIFHLLVIGITLCAMVTLVVPVKATPAFAQTRMALFYTISYSDTHTPPLVTLRIQGAPKSGIDLVVSPMTSFDMEKQTDAFTWIIGEIQASTPEGNTLPIEKRGLISSYYSLVPINPRYRVYRLDTQGHSEIILRYQARVPIVVGYLETLLLRPARHAQVGPTKLRFELPPGWHAVTVVPPMRREFLTFDLQQLNTMYGDNINPALNYVPMAFAVGPKAEIIEIQTDCGRLIFSYPSYYPLPFGEREKELGRRMYEFMCHAVGPSEPYRIFIANNNWQSSWMPTSYQPGLYTYFWQHNRTMDWSTGVPTFRFSPWRLKTMQIGKHIVDVPNVTYYHFPHALTRSWFMGTTYFVLRRGRSDAIIRGGYSGYLQERMLYCAFNPVKVYERWQATYEYYKKYYLGTPRDRPPFTGDHFIVYFKSELWAFYANQKILEATNGQHDLTDVIRWLYAKFGGTGRAYDYSDIQEAINIAANTDLSYLFDEYWYTTKPLPLDEYFADNDRDGVPNGLEQELRLNPTQEDTDSDGIKDLEEIERIFALDPMFLCIRSSTSFTLMNQIEITSTPTPTLPPTSTPTPALTSAPVVPTVATPSYTPSALPTQPTNLGEFSSAHAISGWVYSLLGFGIGVMSAWFWVRTRKHG